MWAGGRAGRRCAVPCVGGVWVWVWVWVWVGGLAGLDFANTHTQIRRKGRNAPNLLQSPCRQRRTRLSACNQQHATPCLQGQYGSCRTLVKDSSHEARVRRGGGELGQPEWKQNTDCGSPRMGRPHQHSPWAHGGTADTVPRTVVAVALAFPESASWPALEDWKIGLPLLVTKSLLRNT